MIHSDFLLISCSGFLGGFSPAGLSYSIKHDKISFNRQNAASSLQFSDGVLPSLPHRLRRCHPAMQLNRSRRQAVVFIITVSARSMQSIRSLRSMHFILSPAPAGMG